MFKKLSLVGSIFLLSYTFTVTAVAETIKPASKAPYLNTKIMDTSGFSEKGWNYHRLMGPLESTLQMLKEPKYPAWRLHLLLYPVDSTEHAGILGGYRVVANRINLSPAVYKELVENAGDMADPSFNNHTASDSHELGYFIIQNNPSVFDEDKVKYTKIESKNKSCGLMKDCSQSSNETQGDLGESKQIQLEKAPWDKKGNISAMLVRALAKQAGWLTPQGINGLGWSAHEQPEGMTNKTPWVEVIISNGGGSVGAYAAEWHDLVADDSISREIHTIVYEPFDDSFKADAYHSVLCSRGENKGKIAQKCS